MGKLFFPLSNYFFFKSIKYISPFNFGLLKISENFTHLTFPKIRAFKPLWLLLGQGFEINPKMRCWLSKRSQIQTSLVKIQFHVVFTFRNDLSLLTTKTNLDNTKDDGRWRTIKRWECWQGMTKWQQMITWVSNRDIQNTKSTMLDTNIFFSSNRGHEMSRAEGIGHDVGGYQEIHRNHYRH